MLERIAAERRQLNHDEPRDPQATTLAVRPNTTALDATPAPGSQWPTNNPQSEGTAVRVVGTSSPAPANTGKQQAMDLTRQARVPVQW